MKWNRLFSVMLTMLLITGMAGCEYVHEPWVSQAEDLKQQRERSTLVAEQLRVRLHYTQIDR